MPDEVVLPEILAASWVVVPAYGEAGALPVVVSALRGLGWSVVVVDDGSQDGTSDVAQRAGARVVRHPVNLGQGAALRTGIAYALAQPGTRFIVTFDADGQHAPNAAADLVAPLARGEADVALGSRFLSPEGRASVPLLRRLLLSAATRVSRFTTRLPLTDSHNGLRAMTADAVRQMHLEQDRMAHASEILSEVARLGLRWVEVPVQIRYTTYSLAKGQRMVDAVSILWDLFLAPRRPRS